MNRRTLLKKTAATTLPLTLAGCVQQTNTDNDKDNASKQQDNTTKTNHKYNEEPSGNPNRDTYELVMEIDGRKFFYGNTRASLKNKQSKVKL